MARIVKNLSWNEVDPSTLSTTLQHAYSEWMTAAKLSSDKKMAFEATMAKELKLPSSQRIVTNRNFGKLNVAFDDAVKSGGASSKAVSFASLKR